VKKITLAFIFSLCIVAGLVHAVQRAYDARLKATIPLTEDFKYLPSGTFLKGAALSFDEILADLLWIKTIGYFGEHYQTDKNFQWLQQILDVTTTLDPYFEDPYEFGALVLGSELNSIDKSTELLKKGMANVPKHHKRYWYLPFFTAFNYMYHKKDYKKAAHYLEIAASFPQRPAYLPLLVSRLYANTDDPGIAIPFLQKMTERASTPEMKEKLLLRMKEIQVKSDILLLTKACERFKQFTGMYPKSLNQLVTQGIIKKIPQEPFGDHYTLAKDGHSIHTSSEVDDMKLHISNGTGVPLILQERK
jgi:hypothetical protein